MQFIGLVQQVKNITDAIGALAIPFVIPFAAIALFKALIAARAGLAKVVGGLNKQKEGLTGKARDWANSTDYKQRREMAKDFRKQERRRGNINSYAESMTAGGVMGRVRRMRAAGIGNTAGQQRAYVAGVSQQEKEEHEELGRASLVLEASKVNTPSELRAIAQGRTGTGVTGQQVNGNNNHAMQMAAIQRLINAEDSEQLEELFMSPGIDQGMLVSALTKEQNYGKVKSAGAHLVAMGPKAGNAPYTREEIDEQALIAMGKLSADKLAQQDGPSIQSAVAAFQSGAGTIDQQRAFYDKVQEVYANSQTHKSAKGSALVGNTDTGRDGMDALFSFDVSTGSSSPNVPRP